MSIDKPNTDAAPKPPADPRDTVPETPDAKRDASPPVEAKIGPETGGHPELTPLVEAFGDPDTSPGAALNLVETFDPAAMNDELKEDLAIVTRDYGLTLEELPENEQKKLAAYWLGVKKGRTGEAKASTADALEARIGYLLFDRAMQKVDTLTQELQTQPARSYEELEEKLRGVMRAITEAAKNRPVTEDNEYDWKELDFRYRNLLELKTGADADVRQAFEKTLEKYSDFIEYDLMSFRLGQDLGDIQKIMQELYGRTPEEMEAIKKENRVGAAALIKELADKPKLDIKDLQDLHRVNNKGIVPKKFGNIRNEKGAMPPTFYERVGLLTEDLRPALEDVLDSANRVRAGGIGEEEGQYTKQEYAIIAAQLHNAILDMHPWSDRNGSTSLLFLETMMTKTGYEPPAEREKDFYKNVANILDQNVTAMTLVAEEQMRMKEPGFYDSQYTDSQAKVKDYRRVINVFRAAARRPRVKWEGEEEEKE